MTFRATVKLNVLIGFFGFNFVIVRPKVFLIKYIFITPRNVTNTTTNLWTPSKSIGLNCGSAEGKGMSAVVPMLLTFIAKFVVVILSLGLKKRVQKVMHKLIIKILVTFEGHATVQNLNIEIFSSFVKFIECCSY